MQVYFHKEIERKDYFMAQNKIAQFFSPRDMTTGSTSSAIIQFTIPLLIGNIAQQLYSTVDSIVVGQYVGDNALAAVGASGPVTNLLLVLFVGISTGAGIMVSQFFGARDKQMLSKTIGNTLVMTLLAGIAMMLMGVFLSRPFLELLDTPAEILDMAATYLRIIFIGIIGFAFYNILSGILRGLGDSFMPLVFLLVCCGLNIILDLLFVAGFKMGVAGVAWATILSWAVSAVLCFIKIIRMKDELALTKESLKLDGHLCRDLILLGLPSGATQAIFSLSMVVVQSLTNSMGTDVIACNVIIMRVDGFAMMPNFSFGMAMTTFVGQNVGANRMDRVEEGTKNGLKMGVGTAVVLVLCLVFFGKYLIEMFTRTEHLIELSINMLRVLAVGYVAMAVTQILSGVMRGAGDTVSPMWISLVTTVAIRVPLAYLFAFLTRNEARPHGEPIALFLSMLISWLGGALITFLVYRRGKWKAKSVTKKKAR